MNEHQRRHDDHEPQEQPADRGDALVVGGLAALDPQAGGHVAKHRVGAHGAHHGDVAARYHGRTHEHDVGEVRGRRAPVGCRLGAGRRGPLHGNALACERGHAQEEVAGGYHARVRRDDVARGEVHDVAHHHVCQRDLPATAVRALHAAGGLDGLGQGLGRIAAPALLHKAKRRREQDHRDDDDDRGRVAVPRRGEDHVGEQRDQRKEREDARERVEERLEEADRGGVPVAVRDLVGPVRGAGELNLGLREPPPLRVELGERVVHVEGRNPAQPVELELPALLRPLVGCGLLGVQRHGDTSPARGFARGRPHGHLARAGTGGRWVRLPAAAATPTGGRHPK